MTLPAAFSAGAAPFACPSPVTLRGTLNSPLRLALATSVALHLVVLAWQHGALPRLDAAATPPLQIVLRAAEPVARPAPPAAVLTPPRELAQPAAARAKPVDAPRAAPVLTRATAAPAIHREAPRPAPASVAASVADSAAAEAPPAPPTAPRPAAPVAHAEAVAAPPAAAVESPPDPAQLERYGRSLSSLFARQQSYPRMAAMRGWEGEVQLRITIARKGNIVETQVVRSSGFELLDQNAVQLVTSAPLPRPPETLQNREIQIVVPVHYKLEKSS